jgi:hypothetical protein
VRSSGSVCAVPAIDWRDLFPAYVENQRRQSLAGHFPANQFQQSPATKEKNKARIRARLESDKLRFVAEFFSHRRFTNTEQR